MPAWLSTLVDTGGKAKRSPLRTHSFKLLCLSWLRVRNSRREVSFPVSRLLKAGGGGWTGNGRSCSFARVRRREGEGALAFRPTAHPEPISPGFPPLIRKMNRWAAEILRQGFARIRARLRPGWTLEPPCLRRCGGEWTIRLRGRSPGGVTASRQVAVRLPARCRPGHPEARRLLLGALAGAVGEVAAATGGGLRMADWSRTGARR